MKKQIKLEARMFNQGFYNDRRILVGNDWTANGDWMIHRSKVNLDQIVWENYSELTDSMIDGVLNRVVDESIKFYKTNGRKNVNNRQCVLFSSGDDKKIRYIQLRYVRYFGLKTLYSKNTIEDDMLWTEDKKFFIMPVRQ